MNGRRARRFLIACAMGCCAMPQLAQSYSKLDLSLGYVAQHSNPVGPGGNFWLQGGSAEFGVDAWHGLGVAVNVTGTYSSAFGPSNVPLGLLTTTFGPRYRYTLPSRSQAGKKNVSAFVEGLVGEIHGFHSLFPDPSGLTDSSVALATQAGGGVDLGLTSHVAARVIEASWLRTQLPNSTTNVQNTVQLGAGIVLKF